MQHKITEGKKAILTLSARLHAALHQRRNAAGSEFFELCAKLDALSPLKVLERGYGLVRGPLGNVVTSAEELRAGDAIRVRFARGQVRATIDGISEGAAGRLADDTADGAALDTTASVHDGGRKA